MPPHPPGRGAPKPLQDIGPERWQAPTPAHRPLPFLFLVTPTGLPVLVLPHPRRKRLSLSEAFDVQQVIDRLRSSPLPRSAAWIDPVSGRLSLMPAPSPEWTMRQLFDHASLPLT